MRRELLRDIHFKDYFGNDASIRVLAVVEEPEDYSFDTEINLTVTVLGESEPAYVRKVPMFAKGYLPRGILDSVLGDATSDAQLATVGKILERQKFNALVRYPGQLTPYC